MIGNNELLRNTGRLHTTELGKIRIAENLEWTAADFDIVAKCREMIESPEAEIIRKVKIGM